MKETTLCIRVAIVICTILGLLFVSCNQATGPDLGPDLVSAEFEGVWLDDEFTPDELTITTTTLDRDTGLGMGTMECSITSYDENVNHIEMSTTSATGIYTYPIGTVLYVTYSVSGNELYMSMDTAGYPASALSGPYIRQ